MNITASLPPPPPPLSIAVFPLLPSSLLLHYSSVRRQSPAHGSSCCSSRSIEPAGSPRLQLLLSRTSVHPPRFPFPSMETQSWSFSAAERESEPPSSCSLSCWEEEKPKRREERIFSPFFWVLEESWSSASNLPPSSLFGLQFWLCVGTRKRGPKCLKPITCCRCLGVTLRCVALIYVACGDTALASL